VKAAAIVIVGGGALGVLALFVIMRRKLERQMRRRFKDDGR
jgi:hypothetical protein